MSQTILIIDDDPTLVEMLTFVLTRGGYETVSAYDGAQALAVLKSTPVDLAVLDVMLPDTDGYEVCRQIRGLPGIGQLPILMLSARTQVAHRLTGFESGADDYVPKPADPKEILARVKALLSRADRSKTSLPPVITLVGAKGGSGTTTTAVNVALSLLTSHRRVLLVDISTSGLSGAWQLGIEPGQSLLSLATAEGFDLSSAVARSCIQVHQSNLHYMSGRSHDLNNAKFPTGVLSEALTLLQSQYEAILVDVGAGTVTSLSEVIRQSVAVVPVTERDPLGIWHLEALCRWLSDYQYSNKVPGVVLVDRAMEPSRQSPSSLASRIGLGILSVIPPAPLAMYHAVTMQEPIILSDPESEVAQAYARLGEILVSSPIEAPVGFRP